MPAVRPSSDRSDGDRQRVRETQRLVGSPTASRIAKMPANSTVAAAIARARPCLLTERRIVSVAVAGLSRG